MSEQEPKSNLRIKTEKLVEDLFDELMKSNIMTFLWYLENNENRRSLQDFIDFLLIGEVMILLIEMNEDAYDAVLAEARKIERKIN